MGTDRSYIYDRRKRGEERKFDHLNYVFLKKKILNELKLCKLNIILSFI